MSKRLEQIQEENRKAIILANNPEAKDYDEAVLLDIGCSEKLAKTRPDLAKDWKGKPLTLDRVLIALDKTEDGECMIINTCGKFYENGLVKNSDSVDAWCGERFQWNLTKPTLEEQTEKTQIEINKLLTNKHK